MFFRRWALAVGVTCLLAGTAHAQESQLASDLRREGEHVAAACSSFSPGAFGSCVYTLTTDYPFHVSLGSLAPGNGFAFGGAFSERYTPNESWRLSWSGDAVATAGGAWRGGAYMKIVHTPATSGVVVARPGQPVGRIRPREFTVVDVFAQSISLDTIGFYGTGPSTTATKSLFGETQTIAGATGTIPLGAIRGLGALRPSLVVGVAGRRIRIRGADGEDAPSITTVYTDTTAPGLARQGTFVQFTEGVRVRPSLFGERLRLDYQVTAQQFSADSAIGSSFLRWVTDLRHEIPLYRNAPSSGPREFNGPNECAQATGSPACPPVSRSRNRQGALSFRLVVNTSTPREGHRVPFYLQPTLGGSDLNGERLLASYDDYRFRAPNLIGLQETLEHSLWGPIGVFVQAEHGKVAARRADLDFSGLTSSATVGLTLRAGGFPMVNLSFSWGKDGHHVIGAMNTSLLGGNARPSLF